MRRSNWPPDPLECWQIVASGRKKALSKGFWDGDEGPKKIRAMMDHPLENGLDPLSLTDAGRSTGRAAFSSSSIWHFLGNILGALGQIPACDAMGCARDARGATGTGNGGVKSTALESAGKPAAA